jgi:aspartyl-tRNA(Asn)/glutamyl-tRNA(Gln) amidotransferase subunit C
MTLDKKTVHQIARLARLDVPDTEIDQYLDDLSRILALVEQMETCNTDGIRPMTHPFDSVLRLREDTVTESDNREKFQKVAPAVERGLYLVPRAVE